MLLTTVTLLQADPHKLHFRYGSTDYHVQFYARLGHYDGGDTLEVYELIPLGQASAKVALQAMAAGLPSEIYLPNAVMEFRGTWAAPAFVEVTYAAPMRQRQMFERQDYCDMIHDKATVFLAEISRPLGDLT